jgi:undecaprenyl-diphosphatase
VAEATIWPIMPDAVLVPLALARPSSWSRLVLAAALGTTVGGAISYLIGQGRPDRDAVERLPLVRPAMVSAADHWLAEAGPGGVLRQPASGIPMKVFARLGGMRGLPLWRLLLWAVLARGLRFAVAAGGAALLGRVFRTHVERWYWPLTLLWGIIFGVGLWRAVAFWERRSAESSIRYR